MRTTYLFRLLAWLPRPGLFVTAKTQSWLLLAVTLAVSAIALDVTFLLAARALHVLVLFCQLLGVISLLLSLHEVASAWTLHRLQPLCPACWRA